MKLFLIYFKDTMAPLVLQVLLVLQGQQVLPLLRICLAVIPSQTKSRSGLSYDDGYEHKKPPM